jgi:hypothetical protein
MESGSTQLPLPSSTHLESWRIDGGGHLSCCFQQQPHQLAVLTVVRAGCQFAKVCAFYMRISFQGHPPTELVLHLDAAAGGVALTPFRLRLDLPILSQGILVAKGLEVVAVGLKGS